MHIKQVTVKGFKSYKDETRLDDLSERVNVVVGANGSGKSNLFHAIRFVIDCFDEKEGATKQARQQLLHEGTGHAVPQAWVEITFDNADGRLGTNEMVILRRTITLKEDKYKLDGKHISKREVQNLLEAAGFSRSNPYNIVQQGKIAKMSQLEDSERLKLLKEVGGASLYEDKRAESYKTMMTQREHAETINESLKTIKERLEKLAKEREQLLEYQMLDKKRKAIEFCILDHDRVKIVKELNENVQRQEDVAAMASHARDGIDGTQEQFQGKEAEVQEIEREISTVEKAVQAAQQEVDTLTQRQAQLDIDIKEFQSNEHNSETEKDLMAQNIEKLETEVQQCQQKLQDVQTVRADLTETDKKLQAEKERIEGEREGILKQHNMQSKFKTKAERDEYLQQELATAKEAAQNLTKKKAKAEKDANEKAASCAAATAALNNLKDSKTKVEGNCREKSAAHSEANKLHNGLLDKRKELWKAESDARDAVKAVEGEASCKKSELSKLMAVDILQGLQALEKLVKENNVQGVLGPLIDLVECRESMRKCIERSAGNRLFNVVVENADVAQRCIELLTRNKLGRLTFLPLADLRPHTVDQNKVADFHQREGLSGAKKDRVLVPIVEYIEFDPAIQKAIDTIWGKVLIAKDLSVANRGAKFCDAECTTRDGVRAMAKGTVEGGYVDNRKLRIKVWKERKDLEVEAARRKSQCVDVQCEITNTEKEIKSIVDRLQQADRAKKSALGEEADMNQRLADLKRKDEKEKEFKLKVDEQVTRLAQSCEKAQRRVEQLKQEMASPMQGEVAEGHRARVTALEADEKEVTDKQAANRARLRAEERMVHRFQKELVSLKSALADKRSELEALERTADPEQLEEKQTELRSVERNIKKCNDEVSSQRMRLSNLQAKQEKEQEVLEALQRRLEDQARAQQEEKGQVDELKRDEQRLRTSRDDIDSKMRDLGALGDTVGELRGVALPTLRKKLAAATREIEKTGSTVNQKAVEEFGDFIEEQKRLTTRGDELKEAEAAIQRLMGSLDAQKDSCLQRTFKDVSLAFKQVFHDLVPGGEGNLIMATDKEKTEKVYVGVKVKVRFGNHEPLTMRQLSGGQKTLCSLALIFAIQRTDPAPFYLLDEVDAALDPQYRKTVASLLQKQATEIKTPLGQRAGAAQFIVTTFHPQIVEVSDKSYATEHSHRVSRVREIPRKAALQFVVQDKSHQKAPEPSGKGRGEDRRPSKRQKENSQSLDN